jgi:hypothetical protein
MDYAEDARSCDTQDMMIDIPVVKNHMAVLTHHDAAVVACTCECGWASGWNKSIRTVLDAYVVHLEAAR